MHRLGFHLRERALKPSPRDLILVNGRETHRSGLWSGLFAGAACGLPGGRRTDRVLLRALSNVTVLLTSEGHRMCHAPEVCNVCGIESLVLLLQRMLRRPL